MLVQLVTLYDIQFGAITKDVYFIRHLRQLKIVDHNHCCLATMSRTLQRWFRSTSSATFLCLLLFKESILLIDLLKEQNILQTQIQRTCLKNKWKKNVIIYKANKPIFYCRENIKNKSGISLEILAHFYFHSSTVLQCYNFFFFWNWVRTWVDLFLFLLF